MSTQPILQLSHTSEDTISITEIDFPTACRLLDDYIDFVLTKIEKFKNFEAPKKNWYTASKNIKGHPLFFSLLLPFPKYVSDMQLLTNKSHVIYERGNLNIWEKMELGLKLDRAEETLQTARAILKEYEPYIPELPQPSGQK